MWTTFSKQATTQKILVPGTFGTVSTISIPSTSPGIEIVPEDSINTVRFVNLSLEAKADNDGDPISVYISIGGIPTSALYSFEMLSGQQEYAMQINGQQIKALAESGQTIKMNVQIANAVSKNL